MREKSRARIRVVLLAGVVSAAVSGYAGAATLTWDSNGTGAGITDGGGSWTGANLWHNGSTNVSWTNGSDAVIGNNNGAAGTISIASGGVTANSITFNTTTSGQYTITSVPGTLTLSGDGDIIVNNSGTSVISATVAGVRLTKSGANSLELGSASSSFTGLTITQGQVLFRNDVNNAGNSSLGVGGHTIYISGNSLLTALFTTGTLALDRPIDLLGNARLRMPGAATGTLTVGSATNGITNSTSTPLTLELRVDESAGTMAVAGVISGTGTSLNKTFAGTAVLRAVNTYTGSTTVTAGTLRIDIGDDRLPTGTELRVATGSTFDLNRRNQTVAMLSNVSGSGGIVTNSNSAATATLTVTGTSTFDGTIQNGAGVTALTKSTGGTLTLNGNSTYTGATNITAGTLMVNGSLGNTAVSVSGTLGGSGSIAGSVAVNSGGVLAPGTSPGSILLGSLSLNANSTLAIELGGTSFTFNGLEEYDRVKVTGSTTLGGALSVSLYNSFIPSPGDLFGIVHAVGSRAGAFSNYAEGETVLVTSLSRLRITYQGHVTDTTVSLTGGNDVVLYAVEIPEPASALALLASGLLVWSRRRRHRQGM